ncbi:myopalladin-like isoform X1, partial [Lates japonicus]
MLDFTIPIRQTPLKSLEVSSQRPSGSQHDESCSSSDTVTTADDPTLLQDHTSEEGSHVSPEDSLAPVAGFLAPASRSWKKSGQTGASRSANVRGCGHLHSFLCSRTGGMNIVPGSVQRVQKKTSTMSLTISSSAASSREFSLPSQLLLSSSLLTQRHSSLVQPLCVSPQRRSCTLVITEAFPEDSGLFLNVAQPFGTLPLLSHAGSLQQPEAAGDRGYSPQETVSLKQEREAVFQQEISAIQQRGLSPGCLTYEPPPEWPDSPLEDNIPADFPEPQLANHSLRDSFVTGRGEALSLEGQGHQRSRSRACHPALLSAPHRHRASTDPAHVSVSKLNQNQAHSSAQTQIQTQANGTGKSSSSSLSSPFPPRLCCASSSSTAPCSIPLPPSPSSLPTTMRLHHHPDPQCPQCHCLGSATLLANQTHASAPACHLCSVLPPSPLCFLPAQTFSQLQPPTPLHLPPAPHFPPASTPMGLLPPLPPSAASQCPLLPPISSSTPPLSNSPTPQQSEQSTSAVVSCLPATKGHLT